VSRTTIAAPSTTSSAAADATSSRPRRRAGTATRAPSQRRSPQPIRSRPDRADGPVKRTFRLNAGRGHLARAVDEELEFHLDMRAQRLVATGLTPDAARQEALRQFGDVDSVRDFCVTNDE